MRKGKLIVVEGACDGIGKTTQFELLKKHLVEDDKKIYSHHFPTYNSIQGKPVEEYLAGKYGKPSELSPYFINTLYAEDRAITWNKELKDKYNEQSVEYEGLEEQVENLLDFKDKLFNLINTKLKEADKGFKMTYDSWYQGQVDALKELKKELITDESK